MTTQLYNLTLRTAAGTSPPDADDASVVRLLDGLLEHAVAARASDLHFEPYEHHYRVRCRIDGTLHELARPPVALKDRLAARLKVLARLDIAERRLPQDGRIPFSLPQGQVVELRISTLPTLFGEKVAVRILDTSLSRLDLDTLGYAPEDKALLLQAIARPHGMVLATGPTGSGKTLSLYSCLHRLNQPGIHIASVEDPCEIPLSGINQVHVNSKAGLDFATVLRAFLRQDPDVLMVGEIRDLTTADIALKAAQTGHLVLSTLHTNDAPSAITRLRHMGVAPWHLAASLSLVSAQRLVRKLCPSCREPIALRPDTMQATGFAEEALHENSIAYRPVGCSECHGGYAGRTGIFQLLPVTEALQELILSDAPALELERHARKHGMRTLREAGLRKVLQGETSLQEVLAVTHG